MQCLQYFSAALHHVGFQLQTIMLDSLKQMGRNVGRELTGAWESLADGWHELISRSGNALTHFTRSRDDERQETGDETLASFPRWSLLAGEVEETARDVVVRLEIPGISKEDCHITIEGNTLYLSGEKHMERDAGDSTYHVRERAYGAFQRAFSLPRNVDTDKAEAHYRNGVLTVRLPKTGKDMSRSISVS